MMFPSQHQHQRSLSPPTVGALFRRGNSSYALAALVLALVAAVAPFPGPGVAATALFAEEGRSPGWRAARHPGGGARPAGGRRLQGVVEVDDHDDQDHSDHEDGAEEEEKDDEDGDAHEGHDHSSASGSTAAAAAETAAKPWGAVLLATLLVNVATLSGLLLLLLPVIRSGILKAQGKDPGPREALRSIRGRAFDVCVPAFAVGALMATAVFLILPEAMHLIEGGHAEAEDYVEEDDHAGHDHRVLWDADRRFLQEDAHEGHDHGGEGDDEGANAAKFGCALLGGFLLPMVLSLFFPHSHDDDDELDGSTAREAPAMPQAPSEDAESSDPGTQEAGPGPAGRDAEATEGVAAAVPVDGGNGGDVTKPSPDTTRQESAVGATPKVNQRLVCTILMGDGFHNIADGIFIGIAFLGCDPQIAWSITAATIFHELVQEVADFIILTRYCGLTVLRACIFNFLSGLTVMLGGIIVLAFEPSNQAKGIILAMGGGVYVYVAGSETIPRIERYLTSRKDRALSLLFVILGAVPIGLVLIDHKHCG